MANRSLWRGKRVWMALGIIFALALLIFGLSAISAPKQSQAPSTRLSSAESADIIARSASAAMSRGETATAVKLAKKALALDSGNTVAQRVQNTATSKPQDETQPRTETTSTVTTPAKPGIYAAEVKDPKLLLPTAIKGWDRGEQTVEGAEAIVTFEPQIRNASAAVAVRVLVSAHDRGDAKQAKAFLTSVARKAYPVGGCTVAVGAVPDGYVGTNGGAQAMCAFARGRYAFDVIVAAQPGASDADMMKVARDIASLVPAAR